MEQLIIIEEVSELGVTTTVVELLEVIEQGPPGPPGPTGAPGVIGDSQGRTFNFILDTENETVTLYETNRAAPNSSFIYREQDTYLHNQIAAATVWNVAHGLGKYPSVTVRDSGGSYIIMGREDVDLNNLRLTSDAPFSGQATCN